MNSKASNRVRKIFGGILSQAPIGQVCFIIKNLHFQKKNPGAKKKYFFFEQKQTQKNITNTQ